MKTMKILGKLLDRVFQTDGDQGAKQIVEKIAEHVNTFVGQAPQHDDLTILVMKIVE